MTLELQPDATDAPWPIEATRRMNAMYRWQRHIYDGTRRYYLLGRDTMISELRPVADETVLEIGCGTGRNLVKAAKQFPHAKFFGVDVSTEMLTTAISAISRHGLQDRIRVAHGDATSFDPQALFGLASFDHVMISYSLSMIPAWREVLNASATHLTPGGRLHVVDFGNQERLPTWTRSLLTKWLELFDVTPRAGLERAMKDVAFNSDGELSFSRPFRGYAQYGVLTSAAHARST